MTEPEKLEPQTVEFFDETFAIADKIGTMALMRFAKAARNNVDSMSDEGLLAQYELLRQCIADEDWIRFEGVADDKRADGDDLWKVVGQVFEALADRPTRRPSVSSDGPSTTEPSSTSDFESRAIDLKPGRPDLQIAIVRALEYQAS